MPYEFSFDGPDGATRFACELECEQCTATLDVGRRCSRKVCLGLPFCWQHLRSKKHLIIKDSPLQGKGLFAWAPGNGNAIIFRKGDRIVSYDGQRISKAQKAQRYGPPTGPYALERSADLIIDGACRRGAGSFANGSKNGVKNNAKFVNSTGTTMGINAVANIKNGEEVIVSYSRGYWTKAHDNYRTKRKK